MGLEEQTAQYEVFGVMSTAKSVGRQPSALDPYNDPLVVAGIKVSGGTKPFGENRG